MAGLLFLTGLLFLSGCAPKDESGDEIHIILTNGEREGELFSIDDICTYTPEGGLYLCSMQNLYQGVYGEQIWQHDTGDTNLEGRLKDMAINRLVRIKTMSLLAADRGITLSDRQEEMARQATDRYYDCLSPSAREEIGIDKDTVLSCYKDLILADEVYRQIIEETEPEISDDEARTVTVSQILLRTDNRSSDSATEGGDTEDKNEVYQRALGLLTKLNQGEDFEQLAATTNEADRITISFGKGEVDQSLEEAAFSLGEGELSRVIETPEGYVILKCVQSFDREQTDLRKTQIARVRKEEAFTKIYEEFADSRTSRFDSEIWDKVHISRDCGADSENFFTVYEQISGKK
ncbi:MAG: peptidylprolyl isomerase [Lachnospiraceae bacterium]|nr:peptidylprolyl isomerase [Lachnospiraceae bacterium]